MSFLRNRKFREVVFQAVVLSVVAALLVAMVINTRASLEAQSLTTGFGFLERATGWDFSFSVLPYSISDKYSKTLLIGILNTLLLGFLGIFLATIVGIVVGLVRTSKNRFIFLSRYCVCRDFPKHPANITSSILVFSCCTSSTTESSNFDC